MLLKTQIFCEVLNLHSVKPPVDIRFQKHICCDEVNVNMFISQYNLYNMSLINALINRFKMLILTKCILNNSFNT